MSSWVGQRYLAVTAIPPTPPPWDVTVGEPNKIAQWPIDSTRRISPTMRWPSDEFFRPIHARFWGFVGKALIDPALTSSYDELEYFFVDLFEVSGTRLEGSTPLSAFGTKIDFVVERVEELLPPPGDSPGVKITQTIQIPGQPDIVRELLFFDADYSYRGPISGISQIPVGLQPELGPWPYVWAWFKAMSQCYPTDSLTPAKEPILSNELAGVLAHLTPNQSIAGGINPTISSIIREVGGTWFNPANPTELVVPAPWNYVRLAGLISTGTNRVNSITVGFTINGGFEYPIAVLNTERQSANAQNTIMPFHSPHWIAVTPGDVIEAYASQTGGTLSGTVGRSWVNVQAGYFI